MILALIEGSFDLSSAGGGSNPDGEADRHGGYPQGPSCVGPMDFSSLFGQMGAMGGMGGRARQILSTSYCPRHILHVIQRIVNPRFLSYMTSFDVCSRAGQILLSTSSNAS